MVAPQRIQLLRLAWDIVGESFGARQQLYERYVAGDPAHMLATRYLDYDKTTVVERVHTLLEAVPRS
jgi:4-hydroxyphenylacetate 3-monooxygenase